LGELLSSSDCLQHLHQQPCCEGLPVVSKRWQVWQLIGSCWGEGRNGGATHEESSKEIVLSSSVVSATSLLSTCSCCSLHCSACSVTSSSTSSSWLSQAGSASEAVHIIIEGQHWVARLFLAEGTPLLITIRIIDSRRLFLVHRGSCHQLNAGNNIILKT
jgi:hypothetical protein